MSIKNEDFSLLSVHYLVTTNSNGKNYSTATLALKKFIENSPTTSLKFDFFVENGWDEYEIADYILKNDQEQIQNFIHDIDFYIIHRLEKDTYFKHLLFQKIKSLEELNKILSAIGCPDTDIIEQINFLLLRNKWLNKNNVFASPLASPAYKPPVFEPIHTSDKFKILIIKNYKCPFCKKAIDLLQKKNVAYEVVEVQNTEYLKKNIDPITRPQIIRSFPIIFVNNVYIGSLVQLNDYFARKETVKPIKKDFF